MNNLQKIQIVFVVFVLFIGIFFFLGKIRYKLNPISRKILLYEYISKVNKDGGLNAEKYWEFRDLYAATTSTFRPDFLKQGKPFLVISSPQLQSLDFLLPRGASSTTDIVVPTNVENILKTPNEIVYKDGNKIIIKFAKEIDEMKSANGLFTHFNFDLSPYEDYIWYNETTISP